VRSADDLPALLVLEFLGQKGRQGLLLPRASIQAGLCVAQDEEQIGGGLAMGVFEAVVGYWAGKQRVLAELSSNWHTVYVTHSAGTERKQYKTTRKKRPRRKPSRWGGEEEKRTAYQIKWSPINITQRR
jgi:hypothetical protein